MNMRTISAHPQRQLISKHNQYNSLLPLLFYSPIPLTQLHTYYTWAFPLIQSKSQLHISRRIHRNRIEYVFVCILHTHSCAKLIHRSRHVVTFANCVYTLFSMKKRKKTVEVNSVFNDRPFRVFHFVFCVQSNPITPIALFNLISF